MHVASCVDKKYIQHLGVLIISLFENKTCSNNIIYHILHDDLDDTDKKAFFIIEEKYQIIIKFHDVSHLVQKYENIVMYGHISRVGLYRLSIPDIISPSEIGKVLYFDCDIIINGDIFYLWNTDISNYILAAVEDAVPFNRHKALMTPEKCLYFNSGVLLINLKKWNYFNVTEKILKFMANFPERRVYNDQDGMNAILYNDWLRLSPKYNQQSVLFYLPYKRLVYSKEEYIEAHEKPVIIHYTGVIKNTKPWDYIDNHPLKKYYYKYIRLTVWHEYRSKPTSIREIILKFYLYLFRVKMKSGIVFKNHI
jgi:lipopolysaccharide biosynthesis glycosyltransferase